MDKKVRVFLSDWQVLFREGIHFILSGQENFEVIGEATDNEEALSAIRSNPPDVAVLNAERGKISGFEAARRLSRDYPSVAVILIRDSSGDELLAEALKCGARACLTKEANPEELIEAIRQVAQGNNPVNMALLRSGVAAQALEEFTDFDSMNEQVDGLMAHLLPAEADILRRVAGQNDGVQTAQTLGVKEDVLARNLEIIRNKLAANDRAREMIVAAQSKLSAIISRIEKPKKQGKFSPEPVPKTELESYKKAMRDRLETLLKEVV